MFTDLMLAVSVEVPTESRGAKWKLDPTAQRSVSSCFNELTDGDAFW